MSIFNRFLTEFEREMLFEMEKPEMWENDRYTITHDAGFCYWTSNMPFFDFKAYNSLFQKVKTPKISGFIAKIVLWWKYQFTLKPMLEVLGIRLNEESEAQAQIIALQQLKKGR